MPISTERDEGTSNSERIAGEIEQAARTLPERFPGYRRQLAQAALECYLLAAEHDEQRININQKYDELVKSLAREIGLIVTSRSDS